MTASAGPASLQAPALFDRSIDEVETLGFKLAPNVTDLLTSDHCVAMVAWPVQDPTVIHCNYLNQLDEAGNVIVLPAVLYYRHWSTVLGTAEEESLNRWCPGWRRFPSVIGHIYTPLDEYFGGEIDGDTALVRVWDAVPISEGQSRIYLDAASSALDAGRYWDLMSWGEINHAHDYYEYDEQSVEQVFAGLTRGLFHVDPDAQFPTNFEDPQTPFPDIGDPLPGVAEYPMFLPMEEDRLWRMLCARTKANRATLDDWIAHQPSAYETRIQESRFQLWD